MTRRDRCNTDSLDPRFWLRHRPVRTILAVVGVILVVIFVMALWHATWFAGDLQGLTPADRVTAIDDTRGRLIQLGAGVLAAGALIFTALNFRLSREGHVTDRYTKAIQHLGSERMDIRLGAVYALERIMIDSPRDHPTIVEVLAAFIREHSPVPPSTDDSRKPGRPSADDMRKRHEPPPTDVQAALTVLRRRPRGRREQDRLDLRETRLVRTDLHQADLADAILTRADLAGADLARADLHGAIVTGADLADANLIHANLRSAQFANAKPTYAKLRGADLRDANLSGADVRRTDLTDANLRGTILINADLRDAILTGADLTGADLRQTDLTGARMNVAQLSAEQRNDAIGLTSSGPKP